MTKRISQPGADTVSIAKIATTTAVAEAAVATPVSAEAIEFADADPASAQDSATSTTATQDTMTPSGDVVTTTTTTTAQDPMATTPPADPAMAQDTMAPPPAETTSYDDGSTDETTDYTPFIVGGVLLAGGILALALSGGDDDDDDDTDTPTPPPANTAPTFSSGATGTVAENAAATAVVYDANATDAQGNAITYSLSGDDADLFNIDSGTGEVRLKASANFEEGASYSFVVTATDNGSPVASATQAVTVTVTDVNEAPTFATATATVSVDENVDAGAVVYTAEATDGDAEDSVTYTLTGEDADAFEIDAETGEVTLIGSPDFETKSTYSFNVVATDGGDPGLTATQAVTVNVDDVNEPPAFGQATAAVTVEENIAVDTVVFTAAATDVDGDDTLVYSLTGDDAGDFAIDAETGEVTFVASPDFEAQSSYSFNVVATDGGDPALSATQAVTVTVTDLVEEITVDLDGGDIPAASEREYAAADGDFVFVDDAAEGNLSVITGFGEGDIVSVDGEATSYSFSSIGTDLTISLNNNGVATLITLEDAVDLNDIIFDEASAEDAVGFDFFQSDFVAPPPPPPGTADLDAGGSTLTTLDADGSAFTFSEDAALANNVVIDNFSDDDQIVVSGTSGDTAGESYSFTSIDNDLLISFNSGAASAIRINDVVTSDDIIFDEASAVAAVGYDFFSYA